MITLPAEGVVAYQPIGDFTTETDVIIADATIAYQRWGEFRGDPQGKNNVLLVEHALTGDSDAATWWEG